MNPGFDPRSGTAACAVCGLVLDRVRDRGWAHPGWLIRQDHVAVPVDAEDIRLNSKCDFCFADGPRWSLPTNSFEMSDGWGSDGDWAACDDCADHLDAEDWAGLLARSMKSWSRRHGSLTSEQVEGLRRLYRQVARHMRAAPRLTD